MDGTGQLSIDYLAGAMVFFGAIIFLVSSVMGTLPQFQQAQQESELELLAWSMTEVLLKDEGYWNSTAGSGTDWHNHIPDTAVVGLRSGSILSRDKIEALLAMDYQQLKTVFNVDADFAITLSEVVPVDTYASFERGTADVPDYITEPAYTASAADTVYYGSARFNGQPRYVLLVDEIGWYNKLRISEDWNFANGNTATHNLTTNRFVQIAGNTYKIPAAHTATSDGKLLLLEREIGRNGAVPGDEVATVLSVTRFGAVNNKIVRLVMHIWT